jgi:hypothetical protein
MTTSNRLKRGDRVLVLPWNNLFVRALSKNGAIVATVMHTCPVPSDNARKARTEITLDNGAVIRSLTNNEWIVI